MRLIDLIEYLTDVLESHPEGDGLTVRVAVSPHCPIAHGIDNVTYLDATMGHPDAVWLGVSQGHEPDESPHAPQAAWHEDDGEWQVPS
jgi:hypothetical protein